MCLDKAVMRFAGVVVLVSVALAHFVSPYWLLLTVFIGVWLYSSLGTWSWTADGFLETIGRPAIIIVGLFIVIFWVIRPFLYWITTQYVFTNRRIITRAGVISKKGRDMPLAKVNNVSFEVGVLGRILNYGRLEITSASDENLVIDDVPNVEVIQRDVYRLHEQDDDRRRRRSVEQGGAGEGGAGEDRGIELARQIRALGHAGNSERFKEALGIEQQRLTYAFADLVREAQNQGWIASDIDPMAAAVFIQAYTIGKIIDEITPEPVDEKEWLALINRMIERTFAP